MPPTTTRQALDLAVDVAAAARLTVLVTDDSITEPIREAVARTWPGSRLDVLVNCPACVGVWTAAGARAARTWAPAWWDPVARVLAVALAATWTTNRVRAARGHAA